MAKVDRKTWTLRFRVKDRKSFDDVKRGLKWVETRAATDKYRAIKAGDRLRFVCVAAKLERRIRRVTLFSSIPAMLKIYALTDVMPNIESVAEIRKVYWSYPGYREKIKKYGIIAFELE